jgi:uncharacterized membrane protein
MTDPGFKHHPPTIDDITQRNVDTIARMERLAERDRTWPEHLADKIAVFCGSWTFVILHALWFAVWILFKVEQFPFGLLTMIVSLEAIFLSTIIMISQNRQAKIAERRNHLDLQINLLAEQESTEALRLLRELARKQGVVIKDADEAAFEQETKPDRIIEEIEQRVEAYHTHKKGKK